ncbi:MAG: hypothetical protein P8I83_08715 [Paracoccaceae bacterium]|nr:hypothetical protein [Paracoccaceae bacterium]
MTLKARRRLDCADVVIQDRLVGKHLTELVRCEVLLINVSKTRFGALTSQAEINALIIKYVLAGLKFVWRKGAMQRCLEDWMKK